MNSKNIMNIVIVTDLIHKYKIKSGIDTLKRLSTIL